LTFKKSKKVKIFPAKNFWFFFCGFCVCKKIGKLGKKLMKFLF